ncbi:MAG: biopolymer transporter ExbD [Alphaproteobacteria bacterium]|nr:biopolymer transporter ExbD [Alphaproteobacteria bacterium]
MRLRRARKPRRGRIEIIPMIDVMFFLLATFMLASLAMQNLHSLRVNLPRGEATPLQNASPVTLTVTKAGDIALNQTPVTLDTLTDTLKAMLPDPTAGVVVSADTDAPHGVVVQAMLRARQAGVERFSIAVARQ